MPKITRTCREVSCGKEFEIERWRMKDPRRGTYCSRECTNKRKGETACHWEGGISERSQKLHWTWQYRKLRKKLFETHKECNLCGSTYRLCLDHIIPVAAVPESVYEESNVQVLCRDCHLEKSAQDLRNIAIFKRWEKVYG